MITKKRMIFILLLISIFIGAFLFHICVEKIATEGVVIESNGIEKKLNVTIEHKMYDKFCKTLNGKIYGTIEGKKVFEYYFSGPFHESQETNLRYTAVYGFVFTADNCVTGFETLYFNRELTNVVIYGEYIDIYSADESFKDLVTFVKSQY